MKPWFIVFAVAGMVAGCVAPPNEEARDLAGVYTMTKGGFNESLNLALAPDGSYVLDHELFACVIGPNGELPIFRNREEGSWKFEGGMVLLEPKARTKDFPEEAVFAPALARRLIPRREGSSRLLVNAEFPEHLVLRKTKQPTHFFEPTPEGAMPLPAAVHP
jgi:hypothetical protein